jgi:hypothetical protein
VRSIRARFAAAYTDEELRTLAALLGRLTGPPSGGHAEAVPG